MQRRLFSWLRKISFWECESVVASPYTLRVPSGYLLIAPLAQGGQEEWAVVGIRCLAIVVCRGRHVGCLRTGFPFASA